jgi:hypothetical protein
MNNYITDNEIVDKIKNNMDMSVAEKFELKDIINAMTNEEQLDIFKYLIELLDYEFYSINGPKIMFNLGSLNNVTLWKLQYHIRLLQNDTNRKKIIDDATNEFNNDIAKIDSNINKQAEKLSINTVTQSEYKPKNYNAANIPSYQVLMNEALAQ